jgi:hypothetical protein
MRHVVYAVLVLGAPAAELPGEARVALHDRAEQALQAVKIALDSRRAL